MTKEADQAYEALTRGDGYTVLPGLLSAEEAAKARGRLLALKDQASHNDDGILALSNLILAHRMLGEDARLAAVGGRILMPGCQLGGLHVDYPYWAMNPGMPVEPALMLQVIWMLEPFTEENGGTWVAPGSQAWKRYPEEARFEETAIQATGQAGDAVVSHGLLWHRTAVNRSAEPRVALLVNYSQLAIQPMTEMGPFSAEFREAAAPKLRALLGFEHGRALRRRVARVTGY
jgi:hypothetical protein